MHPSSNNNEPLTSRAASETTLTGYPPSRKRLRQRLSAFSANLTLEALQQVIALLVPVAFMLFSASQATSAPPATTAAPKNATAGTKYIGTQQCIECHLEQHQSYLDTTHSRSMESVNVDNELTQASFRHDASSNRYEVFQRDNKLFHKEVTVGADGTDLASTEHEIVYTIGSGTHGKSYVYQDGGFFGQSPLSWYEETNQWHLSPGYDSAFHSGFGRKLSSECFFCHVGSIDAKRGNPNDFSVVEKVIGCERCHGPGELHANKHAKSLDTAIADAKGVDNTIANPAKLSRDLSEAICQQCHLQVAGKTIRSGQDEWNFRPGLRLTDFRIDYQYKLGDDTMQVVGHVEQLHMSKCYQQNETLTCITCHNPHHTPPSTSKVEHYRSICMSCHQENGCGEPIEKRNQVAGNDCAKCHMPKKETEMPHTALTHHRIGLHNSNELAPQPVVGLTSVLDISHLSESDRKRCEAIAKFQIAQEQPENPNFSNYANESVKSLIEIKNTGKADADSNTVLALLARTQRQSAIAKQIAAEVVAAEKKPSRPRIEALRLLAQLSYQQRDFSSAAKHYRELVQYQSEPFDHFQLGIAEQNSGDSTKAVAALRKAIELSPTYVEAHRVLAAILKSQGNLNEANLHTELAQKHQLRMQSIWERSQKTQ